MHGLDGVDDGVGSVSPEAVGFGVGAGAVGHGEGLDWVGQQCVDGGAGVGWGCPIEEGDGGALGVGIEISADEEAVVGDDGAAGGHGLHDAFGIGMDELGWAPGEGDAGIGEGAGAVGVFDLAGVSDGAGAVGEPSIGAEDADAEPLEGFYCFGSAVVVDDRDDHRPEVALGVPVAGDDVGRAEDEVGGGDEAHRRVLNHELGDACDELL